MVRKHSFCRVCGESIPAPKRGPLRQVHDACRQREARRKADTLVGSEQRRQSRLAALEKGRPLAHQRNRERVYPNGPDHHRWKGGRYQNKEGYVRVWVGPGHRDDEHRVVMTERVGRGLLPGEVVHHDNGVPHDNRPENLWLFPSSSSHSHWHYVERNGQMISKPMPAVPLAVTP